MAAVSPGSGGLADPGLQGSAVVVTGAGSGIGEAARMIGAAVPLGRIGDPGEIARWIMLLLSPASSFVTGAVIPVDGGQVIPYA